MTELSLNEKGETGCCPRFNPVPWEEKEINWSDKLFVKDHVTSFMHIPLNFGGIVVKNMRLIDRAGAKNRDQIMLTEEKSSFGSDIYIAVDKDVPGAQMATISGKFLTKVFEGSFKQIPQWIQAMQTWVKSRNKEINKLYFSYTTCPRCAKAYGKNYVILFAKVD